MTLVLRSHDGPRHIAWDRVRGRLLDIRNRLGTDSPEEFSFACVYLVEPSFPGRIPAGEVVSVIPTFLQMIREGARIGGVLIDEGEWRDLGTREEYLRVHRDLAPDGGRFPRYGAPDPAWRQWVHPTVSVAPGAALVGVCVAGAGARVGAGATIEDSILWPGAEIASNSRLERCIVRTSQAAAGDASDRDF